MRLEHSPGIQLSTRFQILGLAGLVLVLYLPVIKSGFFIFDDYSIVAFLETFKGSDVLNLFTSAEGRYWRPLIMLSFWLDVTLFKANSAWMHLHNILLHATNTVLIFKIGQMILNQRTQSSAWPLVGAILFAVHPANTEAVSWIAARTDLLACVFSLLGVYLLLLTLQTQKTIFSWLSALALFFGCLSKEVAWPLLPVIVFCLFLVKDWPVIPGQGVPRIRALMYCLPFLLAGCLYLFLRASVFTTLDQGIGKVVAGTVEKGPVWAEHIQVGLISFGFYLKKIVVPLPLNFAINHVNPLYLWLGLGGIFAAIYFICQRRWGAALALLIFCTLAPAIINAIVHIAWTPYAERYLYLPTALLCMSLHTFTASVRIPATARNLLVAAFFVIFLCTSLYRTIQWGAPVTILAEAVHMNPGNIDLRINYAGVVANTISPEKARVELNHVLTLDPLNQAARRSLSRIAMLLQEDPEQAREDLAVFFDGRQKPDQKSLALMIDVNTARLAQSTGETTSEIRRELFHTFTQAYVLTRDPAHLFAAAKIAAAIDEKDTVTELLNELRDSPLTDSATRAMTESILESVKTRANN